MKRTSKFIFTCLAVLFAFALSMVPAYAFSPSGQRMYKGMDVSQWQGTINFAKVKADGIEMVYIRAGSGNRVKDILFERNYKNAKENGLHIGFYYYVTARNTEQAKQQARYFASLINGKDYDCMPAMDFETFGQMTHKEINEAALAFMETLTQQTNGPAAVYSDLYNAKHIFDTRFAQYPLWIAEYGPSKPGNPGKWDIWAGFQYSSTGSVAGIRGNVDMDHFTDSLFLSEPPPAETTTHTTTQPTTQPPNLPPATGQRSGGIVLAAAMLLTAAAAAAMIKSKEKP